MMVNGVLVILLLSLFFVDSQGKKQKPHGKTEGKFHWGNRICEWDELGGKGHDRTLRITCPGQGKKVPQIKCFYEGDPHKCDWYSGNEVAYYKCLVAALVKGGQKSPCDLPKVSCDHDNQCKGVYLERKKQWSFFSMLQYVVRNFQYDMELADMSD